MKSGEIEIRDWLMSCRVLGRGVEHFLMNQVVAVAIQKGFGGISGRYVKTAKNGMVKDFYAQFGFRKVAETDADSNWHLDPTAYRAGNVYITSEE